MDAPTPFPLKLWQRIAAAVLAGLVLRFALGLQPLWWLAWFAPAPMLLLAYRSRTRDAVWMTILSSLIAVSVYLPFLLTVIPVPVAAFALAAGLASVWVLSVLGARRIVLHYRAWWTVLAFPALCTAADTLMANFLPDTNWGSYGYSQFDNLVIMQLASLLGVGGLVFIVTLMASTLAAAIAFGRAMPNAGRAYALNALLLVAATTYGTLRMQETAQGAETTFGTVAIDDFIGGQTPPAVRDAIWQQYQKHIEALAQQGAQVIVLPEKIAMITPAEQTLLSQRMAQLAARLKVWITVGVALDTGASRTNLALLFAPDGRPFDSYQKHHMAPPERDLVPGYDYKVRAIGSSNYGLAICKDMHFASMGRAYGQRGAAVMLVPAWDFTQDGPLAAKMTATRGIENGFAVVRSARQGWLSVSDRFGRMVAHEDSASMPGAALLSRLKVGAPAPTLYTRIGDSFGWLCTAGAAILWLLTLQRRTQPAPAAAAPQPD